MATIEHREDIAVTYSMNNWQLSVLDISTDRPLKIDFIYIIQTNIGLSQESGSMGYILKEP